MMLELIHDPVNLFVRSASPHDLVIHDSVILCTNGIQLSFATSLGLIKSRPVALGA